MAITDTTKITSAINKQGNSTHPGLGCGAIVVRKGSALPPGDYVMMMGLSAQPIELNNIVWKGAPWTDTGIVGTGVATAMSFDLRYTQRWWLNIESADVGGADAVFYKRCK